MNTICNTCPRWSRLDNENGECRKHAPHAFPEGTFGGFPPDKAWYPVTAETDTCGDHPGLLTEKER